MKPADRPPADALAERVTKLEELFTHLQRTVFELNQVLVEQGQRVDTLQARLDQLTRPSPSEPPNRCDRSTPRRSARRTIDALSS